tara:strand:- start:16207 stop:17310 length:1104 start_codon:yes stop_codon:yes gene_type:complete
MGMRSAPSLEVDAMENQIVVGSLDTPECNVRSQVIPHLESTVIPNKQFSVTEISELATGLSSLASGDLDLIALPAFETIGMEGEFSSLGFQIIGALTPKRPSLVLVSPNRLMYQPKSGIIVSDSELVRRQLLRARPDLRPFTPEEANELCTRRKPPSDKIERARWFAELLEEGKIDGFVISRAEYDNSGQTERRHTLLVSPTKRGAPHFLPKPYSDLIVFISRAGLPNSISESITEPEGNTILWVQSRILADLNESFHDTTGIHVRHCQVGTLLRQAEENRDITLEQACHDSEGQIIEEQVRVEVRVETLSADGRRTLSLDRLVVRGEYQYAVIGFLLDWKTLIEESTREVPKDHPSDSSAPPFLSG